MNPNNSKLAVAFTMLQLLSLPAYTSESSVMEAVCASQEKYEITNDRSCNNTIIKITCNSGYYGNFEDLNSVDKESINTCIDKRGSQSKTELMKTFYPESSKKRLTAQMVLGPVVSDGIERQTFTHRQLQQSTALNGLDSSLLVAVKYKVPHGKVYIKIINEQLKREGIAPKSQAEYDKLSNSEKYKKDLEFENRFVKMIRDNGNYEEIDKPSDPNEICIELGFSKADESIISRNIIPAATESGEMMRYFDKKFWTSFFADDEYLDNSKESMDDKKTTGHRYFESITCVRTAFKETQEYEDIKSTLNIAPHSLRPALEYASDKDRFTYMIEKEKEVKTLKDESRSKGFIENTIDDDDDFIEYEASIKSTVINA